jgi:hypothetical protein
MADRVKHHVFSARTTEDGLRALNDLKKRLGVGWDDLVIDAVNAHYGVSVPRPPKKEPRPKKEKPPMKEKRAKEGKKAEAAKVEPRSLPKAKG